MEYFMTELSGEWAPDHRGDDTLPMELHMRRTRQDERRRYRSGVADRGGRRRREAVGNMDAKTLEKYVSDVIARLYAGDGKNVKAIRAEI